MNSKYIFFKHPLEILDDVLIFNKINQIDFHYGLFNDGEIYEITLLGDSLSEISDGVFTTKYSNINLERKVSAREIAEVGYIIVRDENNNIVYFHDKNRGIIKTFRSNHHAVLE